MSSTPSQSSTKKEQSFTSYDITRKFEETIAEYAGARYGVAVDSCCNALFLSCVYKKTKIVSIPKRTYPGVACSILNSFKINRFDKANLIFTDTDWNGYYKLSPYQIVDSALKFKKGMYIKNTLYCLSFHTKKHLPIGRGGMILTDDPRAYAWLKRARFDGRSELPLSEDMIDMIGWNCYMTPEQAARGLMLFQLIKDKDLVDIDYKTQGYPDLSKIKAYQCIKER